ncbi:MAG: hypothetical protein RLZZ225_115 [Pseudomonadota bacterium]|jgi:hypothetical protein
MELINAMSILNRVIFFVYEQTCRASFQTSAQHVAKNKLKDAELLNQRLLGNNPFGSHGQINLSKIVKQTAIFRHR